MRITNIEKIRNIAIVFACLPIEPSKELPVFVSHPFVTNPITVIPTETGQEMLNVLEEDGEKRFRQSIKERLEQTDTLAGFLLLLTKPYRFTFLDHIQQYLSDDDLGAYLRYVWSNGEYTNTGVVFTKRQLTKLFRRSSKSTLMDEEEHRVLEGLPERITVYRGVSSKNCRDLKVFSWTLSKKQAEWYAGRFSDAVQKVYQAELPREGILAYFAADEEIIADPNKLENIQELN